MQVTRHISITGGALKQWFVAQCYDSACVGLMWWAGLVFLHVPWAPFWGIVAAALQFIPQFGAVLAVFGPAIAALFANGPMGMVYVLILYAAVVVIDGLLLQPVIMKRKVRVPIWASLVVPLPLSFMFGFWGLLLAAPLLAVIYAYRAIGKREREIPRQTPAGQVISGGQLISPGGPTSEAVEPREL
jgi:predicted PurR-regulated permease PerM